jgi:amino acid adenylation domain-containing protein
MNNWTFPADAAGIDSYPLSVLQTGMVYHMELDPETLPYHNVSGFQLRAPFDAELFQRAVDDTVLRHPVLRTSFDFTNYDEPMQHVHPDAALTVTFADLRGLSDEGRQEALAQLVQDERVRPFDLTRPPLVRLFLHRLTDDTLQWTQTEHHAVLDAESKSAFRAEVVRRYHRMLAEPDAPRDAGAPALFREFIALERAAAGSEESRAYWANRLAGYDPVTLPLWPDDNARSGGARGPEVAHRSIECRIPESLTRQLTALAARADVPVRTVLLAAHLKAVGLATGQSDVAAGVVVDGRPDDAAGVGVCGLFLNVLPLRTDLTGGTWTELIQQVHAAGTEMLPHGRYPLASIQWDLGDTPLFETTFDYHESSTDDHRAEPTSYPLTVTFLHDRDTDGLLLRLDHRTLRVRDAQAEDIRHAHLAVLAAMVDDTARHERLSPLGETARQQMLVEWNGVLRPYPTDRCVHELIEAQVRRVPDALAVTDGTVELDYAELNRRANRLARRLREAGAGPETVIAVLAGRTAELAVLLLAILKSGAAYLPLEPQYPAERLQYMLADSGAVLVLAEARYTQRVPEGPWRVWDPARTAQEAAGLPDCDLGPTSTPDSLMYVIYTSGSTGLPKGVHVPHSGVVNYLSWCAEEYSSRGSGGAPVFSSVAFDMIVPNLYTPLITGERLCMLDDSLDSVGLADRLSALAPFNFIKMTPGHLDLLDQLLEPEVARGLAGTLVIGADAFPTRILDSWRTKDPDRMVLNEYGPTEASVGNTVYSVTGPIASDQVPIGRAIPNTTMYVLDHAMNPVPLGATGELYIGGACVVRGYANQPRLTAERFLPDPFSPVPGARMYRTGDLGRWLPSGNLEFQGRNDEQLKMNGYRIELGEIEAALVTHSAVRQSVAAVIGKEQKTPRLVCYYTTDEPVSGKELLEYLAGKLPTHMVPSTLMAIGTLPLNANGKVDRKALPVPPGLCARAPEGRPAGGGKLEQIIGEAWESLLYLDRVRPSDNFLALGGNSLLATQLTFRLRERGVEVGIEDILGSATLSDLVSCAKRVGSAEGEES